MVKETTQVVMNFIMIVYDSTLMNAIITTPSLTFELSQFVTNLSRVLFSHGRICASRREESGGAGE